jgi:hypothetical protein
LISKDEYINKIVCEYWFGLVSSKISIWSDRQKQTWLSAMRSAWNVIYPENEISKRELVMKATIWNRQEAVQWYTDYLTGKDDGDGIENRFEILDL